MYYLSTKSLIPNSDDLCIYPHLITRHQFYFYRA